MLLPANDHEHTDDELAEGVPTWALLVMILWLVPALIIVAPVAALAAVFSRPKRADLAFVDPIEAVRSPTGRAPPRLCPAPVQRLSGAGSAERAELGPSLVGGLPFSGPGVPCRAPVSGAAWAGIPFYCGTDTRAASRGAASGWSGRLRTSPG